MRRAHAIFLVAAIAVLALAGCQSNTAGKPGYVPMNCAGPGSSCDGGR
jgi:hypothetical protein